MANGILAFIAPGTYQADLTGFFVSTFSFFKKNLGGEGDIAR